VFLAAFSSSNSLFFPFLFISARDELIKDLPLPPLAQLNCEPAKFSQIPGEFPFLLAHLYLSPPIAIKTSRRKIAELKSQLFSKSKQKQNQDKLVLRKFFNDPSFQF